MYTVMKSCIIPANTNYCYRPKENEMGRTCCTQWEARRKEAACKTDARFVDNITIGTDEVG